MIKTETLSTLKYGGLIAAAGVLLGPPAACATESPEFLEEIVVTAQKREQSINEVGIAVDVLSGSDLRSTRSFQLRDIATQSPNLNIHGPFGENGYPEITIRGMNADSFQQSAPQAAGTYVDGVYLSNPPLTAFQLFDLDRVEVLKGPQGTLYGRNTTGGAVNFHSRKPTFETEGYAQIGYGRYQRTDFEAALGGALSDTVAGRFALKTVQQSDGPLKNLFNGAREGEIDKTAWRAQLLFQPRDQLQVLLNLHGGQDKSDTWRFSQIPAFTPGSSDLCADFIAGNRNAAIANCRDLAGYHDTDGDKYTNSVDTIGNNDTDAVGGFVQVNLQTGIGTLTSLTAYDTLERKEFYDEDGGPFVLINSVRETDMDQFSQEVHLTSAADGPLTWIVGAYYGTDTLEGPPDVSSDFSDWFGGVIDLFFQLDTDTWAVFGQSEYALSDTLSLITGLRWSHVEREVDYAETFNGPVTFAGEEDLDEGDWSGKIGLDYQPTDDVLLYGSISRGFNAGTFNTAFVGNQAGLQPTDAETLIAYETGFKATLADGTAQLNGAVFFNDYDDMIVTSIEDLGVNAPVLRNAEGASIFGVELQLFWRPTDNLDIRLGGAYLDTELEELILQDYMNGGVARDYDGNRLANSPEWSFNGLVRYNTALPNGMTLVLQSDFLWEDEIFRDLQNEKILASQDHWLVNGRISLTPADDKWNLSVWGRNLGDEQWVTEAFQVVGAGIAGVTWSYPRTYGVSAEWKF